MSFSMFAKKIKLYICLFRVDQPFLSIPLTATVALLAGAGRSDIVRLVALLIAELGGFMAGNAFNSVTDMEIDKANPRTADRPLANNSLSTKEAYGAIAFSFAMVLVGTVFINWHYLFLLPVPGILCLGYSFSKRYTWLCHFIMGVTNATGPVAAWGIFSGWRDWKLILIGAIVCFWTIGFELIYSMQDIEYDKENNMYSIPSVFGMRFAHYLSIICHIIMAALMVVLIYVLGLGVVFCIGAFLGAVILIFEHTLVKKDGVKNPNLAFNLNQIFSIQLMVFTIFEKML